MNIKTTVCQLELGTGADRLRPNPSADAMGDNDWDDETYNLEEEDDEDVMASQNSVASAGSQASASSRKSKSFKDKSLIPTDSIYRV